MHSRKLRRPIETVNQDGRGSEPMIEVGRTIPDEALNMDGSLRSHSAIEKFESEPVG
jgi:hypothetical protein